jgi:hypothetical protein
MLPNLFYKASVALISKMDKGPHKKENDITTSFMNIGTKILNEILAS